MPNRTGRGEWVTKLARMWLIGALVFLGLALAATVAMAVTRFVESGDWMRVAPWGLLAVVELVAAVWVFIIYGVVLATAVNERVLGRIGGAVERAETLLSAHGESLRRLTDLASLSDQAKSLIYQERELEAFSETFHSNLMRQNYDGARTLIETIESRFNYPDEVRRLRDELAEHKRATLDEQIDATVNRIQEIIDRHDWDRAIRDTQRLLQLHPDSDKITALPERIQSAKSRHKRSLLQAYGEAVRKSDVDRSIELLRELDRYLPPQEAAALEDSARGVFKAKLHNLGVQFAINVTDEQWAQALATGDEIIREFPNTRMANEVRTKMDLLRHHADQAAS